MDIREREKNYRRGSRDQGRSLMNLHNNEAGRRVSRLVVVLLTLCWHELTKHGSAACCHRTQLALIYTLRGYFNTITHPYIRTYGAVDVSIFFSFDIQ